MLSKQGQDEEILNLVLNDGDTNSLERFKEKKKTVKRGKTKKFEPVLQAKKAIKINKLDSQEIRKKVALSVSPPKLMSK